MKACRIVILVIIVVAIWGVSIRPSVAAASAVIQNDSMWIDSLGDLHIVGEIKNTGDLWLRFVQVTGTLRDGSSGVVDVINTYTLLHYLPPDDVAPFDMFEINTAKSAQVQSYSLAVEFQEVAALSQKLVVLNVSNSTNSMGWFDVVGEGENQGDIPSTYTQVTATFYDTNGKVIYVGFTYTSPSEIPVGGKCGFKLNVVGSERSYRVARYDLTAESENSRFTSVPEWSSPMLVAGIAVFLAVLATRRVRRERA
jgi:hypothetical protein